MRPLRYRVDLTLSPESEDFSGEIEIDLDLEAAIPRLWLNATQITVGEASLARESRTLHPAIVPGGEDFLGFAFPEPVGPGRATLRVAYKGKTTAKDASGIFRQKEGDDWYLFTQFESIDARRAFPCFDEPAYKVPWQITLHIKKNLSAVSNAPVLSETDLPDGMKAVRFAETKPLPSYLIALGVGPFEFAEGPPLGSKRVPFRVVVPKGQKNLAEFTLKSTPDLLALLEKYFGSPYPYDKLDLLAVPLFGGAMENAGAVTFSRRLLLIKPEEETPGRQRAFATVTAHELAHMWFGDLVTLEWWDDTWLNESFASWMEDKIVEQWRPEWKVPVGRARDRNTAMGADSLMSARRIRQPIESRNDILNAFDRITYAKGAAVLNMFETWIGEERFQKGVQRYLAAHAWGNANADDFFEALSAEAGHDVTAAFATFVDQGGVPLVTATVSCEPDAAPALKLSQRRYLPAGSKGSQDQIWKIPVCVRYGTDADAHRQCVLLTERQMEVPLDKGRSCPEWLLPNAGGTGYYRGRIDLADPAITAAARPASAAKSPAKTASGSRASAQGPASHLTGLFEDGRRRLTFPEKIATLNDLSAFASAGEIPQTDVLALVPVVLRDGSREMFEAAAGIVERLRDNLVPDDLLPAYERFVRKTFGAKARELGFASRDGEDQDTQLLRPRIFSLVAENGEDRKLQAKARSLALRWLDDPKAIQPDMIDTVVSAASLHGDQALFDRFHAEAKKASDRGKRRRLLAAMASFVDPRIVQKRLEIMMTDEFDPREGLILLSGTWAVPETRDLAYAFLKTNYDALVRRLPEDSEASLARSASAFCDEAHRADAEAFFKERTSKAPGGPRVLAQMLERIDLCIALKRTQRRSVESFLSTQ